MPARIVAVFQHYYFNTALSESHAARKPFMSIPYLVPFAIGP